VWASDTSLLAIALAQKNAALHNVKVQVLEGALLDPLPGSFDLIVANLPYLAEDEPDERYAGEPAEAVYAPGDGLGLYRLLVATAPARLSPGGTLLVQLHGRVVSPLET
ncbi:MAG: methyltransferase, partial [Gaiellaceae bacterium]